MWSIPLLAEEGWLRHQLKVAKPPKRRRRARSASAIARSRNSGQIGEIFRPEQFLRTDHPGRAVSERIHFYLWRVHPSSARRGIVCASSIHSQLHRPPLQFDVFSDFLILGKSTGLQLRKNWFPIDAHFKTPSVGRYQDEPRDFCLQLGNKFFGQTDRLRFVVSDHAIDDFDFHYSIVPVWSPLEFPTMLSSIGLVPGSGADSRSVASVPPETRRA